MPTLDPTLRDQLASVIGKENAEGGARVIAESGARAAIDALAVHLAAPYLHQDSAQKQLRNRLRARARQLGDIRHADGRHEIGRLIEQAAYEHWHRMLFARFLAENELLIHPEMNVPVTLAECAEMAATEGASDGWELAGRYASRMLPQIFRPDDPLLAIKFAIDDVRKLEQLLDSLPAELFRASDSLGWCYQFWQARKKKEANASGAEIGANELPAVTQLFTEPYMVQFLLHNTLGAWWVGAGRTLPIEMHYLRVLEDGTPAAGTFERWPRLAAELKVLDPCCGSGHFLVAAFEMLVAFRIAEEGLDARQACDAVLRENLFALEIDPRCVQIAAFALALAAWTYPSAGGYRPLAAMNVACSGLAISAKKDEWERLGGDETRLRAGMGHLWELFKEAPVLGSLIDPTVDPPDSLLAAPADELQPLLFRGVSEVGASAEDHEARVTASGTSAAARFLALRYHLVATNVPYLGADKQHSVLRGHCARAYPDARADLATCFLERCLRFCGNLGVTGLVVPQNWLSLKTYSKLRSRNLAEHHWRMVALLGPAAFSDMNWWAANTALLVIDGERPREDAVVRGIDASAPRDIVQKTALLSGTSVTAADEHFASAVGETTGRILESSQSAMRSAPGAVVTFGNTDSSNWLSNWAHVHYGFKPGQTIRVTRYFWEIPSYNMRLGEYWSLLESTPEGTRPFTGKAEVIMTPAAMSTAGVTEFGESGRDAWGRTGVIVGKMGRLPASIYAGRVFDDNTYVLTPRDPRDLAALVAFVLSDQFPKLVRQRNRKVSVDTQSMVRVPFDKGRWEKAAREQWPLGLPSPTSTDPSQWIANGQPRVSDAPLQVAVARLLGYRWPEQQPDALDAKADADGIVCIGAVRGERPAADRLADVLAAAWGNDWHPQILTDLLAAIGHMGSLEEWLRDAFFRQHCELFHHRPFIWHVWDGHREGFSALVNYHKLDHETLKSLTWSYLGDWIRTQEIEANTGKSGAGDKLAKAKVLQQRLAGILEGEAPLDIFVRWKQIEKQAIGWNPDLDDGVRLNIRPFLTVPPVGAKGAGVLRCKPNIKWGVDRGKDRPGSPWGEIRDNDRHLTLDEKRKARGQT